MTEMDRSGGRSERRRLPILNFRPLLFCAVGACMGIFICFRVMFGGLSLSDFLFSGALLLVAVFPLSWRRAAALLVCVSVFAGLGALAAHAYAVRYLTRVEEGEYVVEGTVTDFAVYDGSTSVTLIDLTFSGTSVGGKLTVTLPSEEFRPGDRVRFRANVFLCDLPHGSNTFEFTDDIRYAAESGSEDEPAEKTGVSSDALLRLDATFYDLLHAHLDREEAELVYALLTGHSRSMDEDVLSAVRRGGVAHIFAVSGLHIGILYGAVSLFLRKIGRWASIPSLACAVLYTAFCGFSVSAVRAVLMCGSHTLCKLFFRKRDMLNALSIAAIVVLLISPAEWLSAGFRLSFGACLGLALFSGPIQRGMRKIRIPQFLASSFSSSISVQIFLFPVLLEFFGYVSFWGILLNLVLIPVMPVIYLSTLVPCLLSLAFPSAASVFLTVPNGLSSALLFVLANLDVSLVITGVTLGMGSAVWAAACLAMSERVRLSRPARVGMLGLFSLLFAGCLFVQNAVTAGCRVFVADTDALAVLVRTTEGTVLVLDDAATLADCENLLARHLLGTPDYAIVFGADQTHAVNVAVFTGAKAVYAPAELDYGFHLETVIVTERVEYAGMEFRYEGTDRLYLFAEGGVVEFDATQRTVRCGDFSSEKGARDLNFFIRHGIIGAI